MTKPTNPARRRANASVAGSPGTCSTHAASGAPHLDAEVWAGPPPNSSATRPRSAARCVFSNACLAYLLCTSVAFAEADGSWLNHVSPKESARNNPYASSPASVRAVASLYRRDCASCHGADALGVGKRPSLRSPRVQRATNGELHWLLTNGSLTNGMPAWSRLPDGERWQLVTYLHALPLEPAKDATRKESTH